MAVVHGCFEQLLGNLLVLALREAGAHYDIDALEPLQHALGVLEAVWELLYAAALLLLRM